MDSRKCQTATASPAEPGELPIGVVLAAPKGVVMPPHTAEFAADLTKVFKRHGWSGLPQQISFSAASGCNRVCDNGSIAQPVWLDCPGGIRKMVCACPGEDPSCDD
jgi:hypothetical protein